MAARKKTTKDLKTQTIEMLRRKLKAAEEELASAATSLRELENLNRKDARRADTAEDEVEAWMDAVRILSGQASNTTGAGRRARVEARKVLEARKIRPPHGLGHSRKRKKKKP